MSKYIAVITRADITRAALVEAGGRSMEQVKAACGCQYIINSWFYDTTTGKAVGNLKINGSVKASAGWNGWGLTWDKGADIRLDILPDNGGASYLSGVELLTPTRGPGKALSYSPEYGGTRGRSAVLLAGARVILYCSGDGTADAKTPEGLRDELVSIGCRYDHPGHSRGLGGVPSPLPGRGGGCVRLGHRRGHAGRGGHHQQPGLLAGRGILRRQRPGAHRQDGRLCKGGRVTWSTSTGLKAPSRPCSAA